MTPRTAFEVHFVGTGITPAVVPIGVLLRSLSAVQRLAAGGRVPPSVERDEKERDEEDTGLVRLVGIRKGSAVFRCTSPHPDLARANLREAGQIVQHPDQIGERGYVLSPVRRLSEAAKSLNCSILIRQPDRRNGVLAKIGSDTYLAIKEAALIESDTSLAGNVQRVGGATAAARKCSLRVAFQPHLLYCHVPSRKIVRKLGQFLYQDIVVRGTALLLKNTWKIVGFTVRDVEQPKQGTLTESFNAIWKAGGKDWNRFDDPTGYLKESRGEK